MIALGSRREQVAKPLCASLFMRGFVTLEGRHSRRSPGQ
jgi:hypothetical protein